MLLVVNHEVIWRNILPIENLVEKKEITTATDKRNTEEKKNENPSPQNQNTPKRPTINCTPEKI